MLIGIDASCWLNRRGYGRYTRELMRAVLDADTRNEYLLFLDAVTARESEELPAEDRAARVVIKTDAAATRAAAAGGSRSAHDLWRMRRAVAEWNDRLDVFFFPADYSYFPIKTRARVVVTKHDMTDRKVPELLFPDWKSRLLWEVKIRLAIRRADVVSTVSETSRRDIMAAFALAPERVKVVADAVDATFVPAMPGPDHTAVLARYAIAPGERFLLYVGGISPHKNLHTLVSAYEQYRRLAAPGHAPVSLVLVGDYTSDVFHSSFTAIRAMIDTAGLGASVRFVGYVPDPDLRHLYSAAAALVLPSFYEGFGLPVLEAMACGAPVVASSAGALPEVVGDCGLLFDPHSTEQLAGVLMRLLGDEALQRDLSSRGLTRAAAYTWGASARAAISMFEGLAR